MSIIDELRQKNPNLKNYSDQEIAQSLRRKPEFQQLSEQDFNAQVYGTPDTSSDPDRNSGMLGDLVDAGQQGAYNVAQGLGDFAYEFTGYGRGLGNFGREGAARQLETMTPESAKAIRQPIFESTGSGLTDFKMGEGFNLRTIALQTASLAGEAVTSGGIAGGGSRAALSLTGRIIGGQAKRNAVKQGLDEAGQRAAAVKATDDFLKSSTANGVMLGTYGATEMAVNTGQIADGARLEVMGMPNEELDQSVAYQELYWKLAGENPDTSVSELRQAAREEMAEGAKSLVMRDPALLLTNAVLGGYGGKALDDIVTKGTGAGRGRLGAAAQQAVVQGVVETGQGGTGKYATNTAIADIGVDPDRNPMEGVAAAGLSEGLIGSVMGGGTGALAGRPRRDQTPPEEDTAAAAAEARRRTEAEGGDPLDQTRAAQAAEQESESRRQSAEQDPLAQAGRQQQAGDVGLRIQRGLQDVDDLQTIARGASFEGTARLRNMAKITERAEAALENGNIEQASRLMAQAERIGNNLRTALRTAGTRERPAEGDFVGREEDQGPTPRLEGRRGQLPPGTGDSIAGESPAQFDARQRARQEQDDILNRRRIDRDDVIYGDGPTRDFDAEQEARRAAFERQFGTAQNTGLDGEYVGRDPLPGQANRQGDTFDGELNRQPDRLRQDSARRIGQDGTIYGDGPTAGNANTGLDQSFPNARFTDTGARGAVESRRAQQQTQAKASAQTARTRGKSETTYLPDNTPIKTRFRVMEASELTPSNTQDGRVNPRYPQELQPRDRTNANSQVQVRNITSRLNPERLGPSTDASTGAPIVGNDGVVESGNGRTMAISTAYSQNSPQAQRYREYVRSEAERQGIDPTAVDEMQQPVLVRERTTSVDRADFARRANESSVAGMTSYEQAQADADSLTAQDIQAWAPDQSGDPLAASNRDFQRNFVRSLGNNEASRYTNREGQATPELGQRMQRAIFAAAYQDADMVEMVTEQSDNMRNLTAGLQAAAPDIAAARETGSRDAQDAINTITDAVRLVRESRRSGTSVRELVRQTDAFSDAIPESTADLALAINNSMRSRQAMTNALTDVARSVRNRAESEVNGALFEDTTTNEDIFDASFQNQDQVQGQRSPEADVSGITQRDEQALTQGGETELTQGSATTAEVEPLLNSYTEAELADRDRQQQEAEAAEQARIRDEEQRAQADAEVDDFTLAGSNSSADLAAAQGQNDLLGAQPDTAASGQSTQNPYASIEEREQAINELQENAPTWASSAIRDAIEYGAPQSDVARALSRISEDDGAALEVVAEAAATANNDMKQGFGSGPNPTFSDNREPDSNPIIADRYAALKGLSDNQLKQMLRNAGKAVPRKAERNTLLNRVDELGFSEIEAAYNSVTQNAESVQNDAESQRETTKETARDRAIDRMNEIAVLGESSDSEAKGKVTELYRAQLQDPDTYDALNDDVELAANVAKSNLDAKAKSRKAKKPKADKPKPKAKQPKEVGKNVGNETVYEDENGIRFVVEDGVRIFETVSITPTRQGVTASADNRRPRFKVRKKDEEATKAKKQEGWGNDNTLVSKDRAEELRARLRAKLGQLNSGFDPEMLSLGAELAAFHMEAGARKFSQFARAMAEDLGTSVTELRPYLRSWYNGGRDLMEDNGLDVTDMDSPDTVREAMNDLASIEQDTAPQGEVTETIEPITGKPGTLADALYQQIDSITDNRKLKSAIAEYNSIKVADVHNGLLKEAQESFELALVRRARSIVAEGGTDKQVYDKLLTLYENQPNLDVRSSTSMERQAYSTPAPMAFLGSRLAGINESTRVYEPTAGNGMLIIGADTRNAIVNELDDRRAAHLKDQGFNVTQYDATDWIPKERVDALSTNPPFGKLRNADGRLAPRQMDGFKISSIDHLIAAKALSALEDDGRATIIIGASKEAGEIGAADRTFFNWLYSHYNVVGHFEVNGDLYKRQGAGWPVRMITVNGRVKSDKISPKTGTIERADTWEQVYEQYERSLDAAQRAIPRSGSVDGSRQPDPIPDGRTPADELSNQQGVSTGTRGGRGSRGGQRTNDSGASTRTGGRNSQPRANVSTGNGRSNADGGRNQLDDGVVPSNQADTRPGSQGNAGGTNAGNVGGSATGSTALSGSQFQTAYRARSAGFNDAVLIPNSMAQPTQDALTDLENEVGNIDEYVKNKLNYATLEDMNRAFMGLQVDAVAASIRNIERGKGVIIADQTGLGKGRQAAAVIRYAREVGKTPVFMTVKDNLFSDMYGDLRDIGDHDVKPFVVNKDVAISWKEQEVSRSAKGKKQTTILQDMAASGRLPEGYDALFLTYSQINTDNLQRRVMQAVAKDAIFVLDEAHEVAGERKKFAKVKGQNVEKITGAGFVYDLIENNPVVYLSATYAKRPDNMPIYYRTDVADAVDSVDSLVEAVETGGTPLQTVVSNMLSRSGQLFRRERSFEGIEIKTSIDDGNKALHEKLSDQVSEGLRAITKADKLFHDLTVGALQADAEEQGGSAQGAGNKAGKGLDHQNFTSVLHNYISQLLLGLKADRAADQAIELHSQGVKPVLALENTMGSFLNEYVKDFGLELGDTVDANYQDVLMRALDRTRRYTETLPNGEKVTKSVALSDTDPVVREAYQEAAEVIRNLDLGDLPISPIDHVRNKLVQADISVAELTGRDYMIDYSGGTPILSRRDAEERKNARGTVDNFNAGRLNAIILNKSGSTGLSIHAGERFSDQKPRHMIMMQAPADINVLMQMLGRVNRTGQVNKPSYTMMGLAIPAEIRPLANTAKKMKSLNANTSSNTESNTSVEALDILNKYGDYIVNEYLKENPRMSAATGVNSSAGNGDPGVALRFTGRLAAQPVKAQREAYEAIEREYRQYIDYLNKTGQNDLEPATVDLDAKIIDTKVTYQGKAPDTIFGGHTYMHKVDGKYQGTPPTSGEVEKTLDKADPEKGSKILSKLESDNWLQEEMQSIENSISDIEAALRAKAKKEGLNLTDPREIGKVLGEKATKLVDAREDYLDRKEKRPGEYERSKAAVERMIGKSFAIGNRVRLDLKEEKVTGVVVGLTSTHKEGKGNPYALSKTRVRFMVNSGVRTIELPLTRLQSDSDGALIEVLQSSGKQGLGTIFSATAETNMREIRYVATGNLIAAASGKHKGRITAFTDKDGQTHLGMLMPKNFDDKTFSGLDAEQNVAMRNLEAASRYMREYRDSLKEVGGVFTENSVGRIQPESSGGWVMSVPKSNKETLAKSLKFSNRLRSALGGDFFAKGGTMMARFTDSQLDAVIAAVSEIGPLYTLPSQRGNWEKAGGDPAPEAVNSFDAEASKSEPRYSLASKTEPQGSASIAIQMAINDYPELGNVNVLQRAQDLPDAVLEDMARNGVNPQDARGVYHKGEIYVIADNVSDAQDGIRAALHEAVGHKGIRGVLGNALDTTMLALYRSLPNSKQGREALNEVRKAYPFLDPAKREDRIAIAEEMVAHLLEKGHRPKTWQRLVAKIRAALRQLFPTVEWSYTDVLALGEQSRTYLRGKQAEQDGKTGARYAFSGKSTETTGSVSVKPTEARYIRLTNKNKSPFSRAGYAMFKEVGVNSDTPDAQTAADSLESYGGNVWVTNGDYGIIVNSDQLTDLINEAAKANTDMLIGIAKELNQESITADDIVEMLSPDDIVDSADGFDNEYLMEVMWSEVFEPNNIDGVRTPDGLVLYETPNSESQIQYAGNLDDFFEGDTENPDIRYSLRSGTPSDFTANFDDMTAEDAEAASKIGPRTRRQTIMDKWREMTTGLGLRLRQGMVDQVAALNEMDNARFGKEVTDDNIAQRSWILARLSNAANGALGAMLNNGRVYLDAQDKVIDVKDDGSTGLASVFAKLGNLDDPKKGGAEVQRFMGWIAGNRADKLRSQGRENLFTDDDIDRMKDWDRGTLPDGRNRAEVYQEAFNEFQQYRDDVLAIAEQSGLLKPAMDEVGAAFALAKQYNLQQTLKDNLRQAKQAAEQEGDPLRQDAADQRLGAAISDIIDAAAAKEGDQTVIDAQMQDYMTSQRDLWKDEFYVPFYRLKEESTENSIMPATQGLSRQQAYKRLKGGTENVNDLLQNTMMNFHHLLDASLKNQAATQAMDNALELGIAEQVPADTKSKQKTFIMRDGQQVHYEVNDPMVFSAVTALAHPGMNSTLMRVLRKFKRMFTNLTTSTPQFQLANLIRDAVQATATSDVSKNALKNVLQGTRSYKDQKTRARMMASGGAFNFGHVFDGSPAEIREQLTKTMQGARLIDRPSKLFDIRYVWNKWMDFNNFTENVNRAAIYQQNMDAGRSKLYSAFESRDLIDFSARGAWPAVRILIDVVPFLNARIQGLDKIYRSGFKPTGNVMMEAFGQGQAGVTDKQAAGRFWAVTGAVTLATIALYLHNKDDEEYEKLEQWHRDTYWWFRIGDAAISIPKPFEVGAIATIAERVTEQFADDEATGKLFAQRMGHMMTDTFSFTAVPQAVQPAYNIYANRDDFTGRPIESMGMDRLSPELRRRGSTTAPATGISKLLNSTVGAIGKSEDNPLALSPVQVDHLIQGYFGQVGAWVAGIGDGAWQWSQGKTNPAQKIYERQPIRRFYTNLGLEDKYTRYGTVFYEGLREAQRAYSDVKELRELGRLEEAMETQQDQRSMLAIRKALNRTQSRLRTLKSQEEIIRRSDMPPEVKRQRIDRLRTIRNQLQRVAGKRIEQARVN